MPAAIEAHRRQPRRKARSAAEQPPAHSNRFLAAIATASEQAVAPSLSGLANSLLNPSVPPVRMDETDDTAPGAKADDERLPWYQDFVARYVAFPAYCRTTSFERATSDFQIEVRRIEEICGRFSADDFVRRVSVAPSIGLEADERHWSASMVVAHAVLVGEAIGRTLIFLSRGQQPPEPFTRKAMRPRGAKGVETMSTLRALGRDYPRLVETELGPERTGLHRHPLFGDLDLHRWHCLSVSHLRVHRRQLHEIRRRITAGMKRGGLLDSLLLESSAEMDPQA